MTVLEQSDRSSVTLPPPPPIHDEDGFPLSGFDYVIKSTSLPLTILASALTIAGKSVLVHDENRWYGGDEGFCSSSLRDSVVGREGGLKVEEVRQD